MNRWILTATGVPVAGLAATVATPVSAQASVSPSWKITAGLEVRTDSNVARGNATQAAARGLQRADQRARPSLAIDLIKPFGRSVLTVDGQVGYDFYRRNTQLNRERIGVNAGLLVNLLDCRTNWNAGLQRRQSDLGEIYLLNTTGRNSVRNVETIQSYGAQLGCGGATGLTSGVGISHDIGDNSNTIRSFSDYRSTSYNANVGYARPTLGKLGLTASLTDTDYPHRGVVTLRPSGYRSSSIGGQFSREIGANLRGMIQAGVTNADPRQPGVASFRGVTWSVDLTGTFDRLQLHGVTGRSVRPAFQNEAAFAVARNYSLDASYALASRLTLGASASSVHRSFKGATAIFGQPLTGDTRSIYSASLAYKRTSRWSVSAQVDYDRRNGNGTLYDYDSVGGSLRLALTL